MNLKFDRPAGVPSNYGGSSTLNFYTILEVPRPPTIVCEGVTYAVVVLVLVVLYTNDTLESAYYIIGSVAIRI